MVVVLLVVDFAIGSAKDVDGKKTTTKRRPIKTSPRHDRIKTRKTRQDKTK